jgi:hypothetical protein
MYKNIYMKALFFLFFKLIAFTCICQVSNSELNMEGKKFLQTITIVAEYLKNHKTIPVAFHESSDYTKEESFYDEVINKHFEKNKTRLLLMEDTSVFSVEGKMDMIRHILNGVDYFLDIIPSDSIFVRPFNSEKLPNTLEVYLIVNAKKFPILLCHFDASSTLLTGLSAGASPRTEEFISYLKRQKKYYEFPDPIIRTKF